MSNLYHPHFKYRTIEDFVKGELIYLALKEVSRKYDHFNIQQISFDKLNYNDENKVMEVYFNSQNYIIKYSCYCKQNDTSYEYVYKLLSVKEKPKYEAKELKKFDTPVVDFVDTPNYKDYEKQSEQIKYSHRVTTSPTPLTPFI